MIRRAVDRVLAVVSANFNSELSALLTAASVPVVAADLFDRLAAERFKRSTSCGLGVYQGGGAGSSSAGGAAGSRKRDTTVVIVLDWWIQGDNEDDLAKQTESAIDAALRCVDRLVPFDAATLVGGAATRDGSFSWEIERTPKTTDQLLATERAVMRFPVLARDTGLQ